MPRIDFYILTGEGADARAQFCCTLAAQAWRDGIDSAIITPDEAAAVHLDALLWRFEPTSFIPHGRTPHGEDIPIIINPHAGPGQWLINLGNTLPSDWAVRERIAEVISADEPSRQAGRQRYRHYQQAGVKPRTHHINQ